VALPFYLVWVTAMLSKRCLAGSPGWIDVWVFAHDQTSAPFVTWLLLECLLQSYWVKAATGGYFGP